MYNIHEPTKERSRPSAETESKELWSWSLQRVGRCNGKFDGPAARAGGGAVSRGELIKPSSSLSIRGVLSRRRYGNALLAG